ncbi:MAG: Hsp20/alpha crystallin family protein [Planctomycetaceae bacterium]|nr:Hsp20/alpha crystallin family protein [Planctomycetaceae bacterium]
MANPQETGPLQLSMDRVRAEMDRLVEMARDRGGRALDAVGIKNPPRAEFPAVDVTETNDAVHLVADLPGVDPDLLDLNVTGLTLRVRGTVSPPLIGQGGTLHRSERHVGTFERTFMLPCTVDADAAHADLKNGVLHVRLPKVAAEIGRKIRVQAGECSTASSPTPQM